MISNVLDHGGTLDEAQALAGHASPDTTSRYNHPAASRLRAAVERVPNPRTGKQAEPFVTALDLAQPHADRAQVDQLWARLTPEFLTTVGWDPGRVALHLEPGPAFRSHRCPSLGCGRVALGSDGQICSTCQYQVRLRGVSVEEIIRVGPDTVRPLPTATCDVASCLRTRHRARLCSAHEFRRKRLGLDQAAYIATNPDPLDSFGECTVPACLRDGQFRDSYCVAHKQRLRHALKADPHLDVAAWAAAQHPSDWDVVVSLRGIPESSARSCWSRCSSDSPSGAGST